MSTSSTTRLMGAVLSVIALLLYASPQARSDELVVVNPSFERGFDGWSIPYSPYGNNPVIDTTEAHTGSCSVKLTKRWGGDRVEQNIPCDLPAGTLVRVRFWFKMPDPGTFNAKWFTVWVFETGNLTQEDQLGIINIFDPSPQWSERSIVLLTRRPVHSITIWINTQQGDGAYAGPVWVDDVSVTTMPQLPQSGPEVWISSWWTSHVLRYDAVSGELRGLAGHLLAYPVGILRGPDGLLYAAHGCWSYRPWWDGVPPTVRRYDPNTSTLLDTFVAGYSGGLNRPNCLAFGPNGDLFVSSIFTHSILRYDGQTGASLGTFVPQGYGGMQDPRMLLFRDGMLYVATSNGVLRYRAEDGVFVDNFVPQGSGGHTLSPANLAIGPSGDLFLTDANTGQVVRFDGQTGAYKGIFVGDNCSDTSGLTFGPDGNLYVPSIAGNCVRRYNGTTGTFIDVFLPEGSGFQNPTYVLFVPGTDSEPPVTVAQRSPVANEHGWNNTDVTVTLTATDEGSGVASTYYRLDGGSQVEYAGPVVVSQAGVHTIEFWSVDNAGNSEQPQSMTVQLDKTKPVTVVQRSPVANEHGWNNTDVTVTLTATDEGSGVATTYFMLDGAQQAEYAGPVVISQEGIHTIQFWSVDNAGNSEEPQSLMIQVDKTKPRIVVSSPEDGGTYVLNQVVPVAYAAEDALSGIDSVAGPVENGKPLDTSHPGSFTFTVVSADKAGNTETLTHRFAVGYRVVALYDEEKAHKSGSTIPIKVRIEDANGTNLSSPDIAVTAVEAFWVDGGISRIPEDTGNANRGLQFRYTDGMYVFNLKTKGYEAGVWELRLTVGGDPTAHSVRFRIR